MTLTTNIRIEAETLEPKKFFKKLSSYADCPDFVVPEVEENNNFLRISTPFGCGAKLWVSLLSSPHPIKDDDHEQDKPLFNKCKTIIVLDTRLSGGSERTAVFIDRLMKEHPHLKFFANNEMTGEWFENENPFQSCL